VVFTVAATKRLERRPRSRRTHWFCQACPGLTRDNIAWPWRERYASPESRNPLGGVSASSTTIPLPSRRATNTVRIVVVVPAPAHSIALRPRSPSSVETLIIDRQPLFLAALGSLLEAPPLSAHVLACSRSDTGLEMVRSQAIGLVFCELRAEPITGVELVRALIDEKPDVPVILLGDEGDKPQLAAALATNVAGVFTKSAALDEFLVGVRAVLSGHRAIGSGLIDQLVERLTMPLPRESRRLGGQLSPTELEILAMIGRAQSIPDIAASRGISHKTVRNHLAKIYRKLELHGRTEAMLWAARAGLTAT